MVRTTTRQTGGDASRKPWRLRLREAIAYATVVGALVLFGLFVWMTRQPEAPLFERAERAPVVGGFVSELRARFLPPPARAGVSPYPRGSSAAVLRGRDRGVADVTALDREYIGIGAAMRDHPRTDARLLDRTERLQSYAVLERAGSWVLVTDRGRRVWIDLDAKRELMPPLGNDPLPPGPLHAREAEADLLAAAIDLMGGGDAVRRETLGDYQLVTDVSNERLVGGLRELSRLVEPAYVERFGLQPLGGARETVVLFGRSEDYEQFRDAIEALVGVKSHGFQSRGLVALFVGRRSDAEVEGTFVHELVHLLNRRAIGPALPAWLSEGLADELALFSGPAVRTREELVEVAGAEIRYHGRLAGLKVLRDEVRRGESPRLAPLISSEPEEFLRAPDAASLYLRSAYLVHFLLEDSQLEGSFREFLGDVRSGSQPSAENLLATLGLQLDELEQRFALFLVAEALKAGV